MLSDIALYTLNCEELKLKYFLYIGIYNVMLTFTSLAEEEYKALQINLVKHIQNNILLIINLTSNI